MSPISSSRAYDLVWVVEFRYDNNSPWEPESVHTTKREAKDMMWVALPPAKYRIRKFSAVPNIK